MATKKQQRKAARKKGRPRGAATQRVPQADATPSACKSCGSTEREPYFNKREITIAGTLPGGRLYNVVVWRRTRCKTCGQQRDDKSFELRNADAIATGLITKYRKGQRTTKPTEGK